MPGRWTLIPPTLASLFIGVGAVAAPSSREQLTTPGELLTFTSSLVQFLGVVLALVFLVPAYREAFGGDRHRSPAR